MSDRPWSGEPAKVTPIAADRLLILDSESANANRLITVGSLPITEFFGPWTALHNAGGQILDNLGALVSNAANPADNGAIRLGANEIISWRNAANDGNVSIGKGPIDEIILQNAAGIDMVSGALNNVSIIASSTANIASADFLRLANVDRISWRNFGNTDDLSLRVDDNDRMLFVGGSGIDMARDELINFSFLEPDVVNPADAGQIRFGVDNTINWRNVANTNNNSIGFAADAATIAIAGTTEYTFSATTANYATNNISMTGGFVDMLEIATPANPPVNTGRLYVADAAGVTTLFFRDNAGNESNLLAGAGGVAGPGSSTDNAIARWDGTGGGTLQNSAITIDDNNDMFFSNNDIRNVGIVNFDATGTTAIDPAQPQMLFDMGTVPDQLLINAPNNTEIALYFAGGEEYTYNQNFVDFRDNGLLNLGRVNHNQGTITYNATLIFDFDGAEQYRQITLTGDLTTLTTLNRAAGKVMTIVLIGDSVNRNLTFNTDWNTNPIGSTVVISANSITIMTFYCTGTVEADVVVGLSEFS